MQNSKNLEQNTRGFHGKNHLKTCLAVAFTSRNYLDIYSLQLFDSQLSIFSEPP